MLLEATETFYQQHKDNSRDFALVREISDYVVSPPKVDKQKGAIAVSLMVAMILFSSLELVKLVTAAIVVSFMLVFTRCLTWQQVWKSIDVCTGSIVSSLIKFTSRGQHC